jgi:hypothetical protein
VAVTQQSPGNILNNVAPATFSKTGQSITLTGESNLAGLTLRLEEGKGFALSSPQYSTDGGTNWSALGIDGASIANDPGAAAVYKWRATLTAAANPTITGRTAKLSVTSVSFATDEPTPAPEAGVALLITLTQAAGDATLTLDKTTITLSADGTAQTVTATSNAAFTVS